jgi:hypothetical protein
MNDTIEALKFWCSAIADAYGPTNQDEYANRVIDGLKASGIKVRRQTYDAICHLHRAMMENRQWHSENG